MSSKVTVICGYTGGSSNSSLLTRARVAFNENRQLRKYVVGAACSAVALYVLKRCLSSMRDGVTLKARLNAATVPTTTGEVDESPLSGSPILPIEADKLPHSMRPVIVENPAAVGSYLRVGNSIRVGDNLIVPYHVVCRSSEFYVVEPGTENYVVVQTKDAITVTADVVAFKLQPGSFSRIGMCEARPGFLNQQIIATAGSFVASGEPPATGYYSTGDLKADSAFGVIQYYGSTRPGFSGGVYYSGKNTVYAVHLRRGPHGSGYNLGIALPYIMALLECQAGKNEDTTEWISTLARRNDPDLHWVQVDDSGNGSYIFEYKGKYYAVDQEKYDTIYMEDEDNGAYAPYGDRYKDDLQYYDQTRGKKKYRVDQLSEISDDYDDDDYEDDDEAASDVACKMPAYKEDQLKIPFLVRQAASNRRHIPVQPIGPNAEATLDVPRIMNQTVQERLTAKALALTEQKSLHEIYEGLKQKLGECQQRFRIAGSDLEKHSAVMVEYQEALAEMLALKPLLKDANVQASAVSAQTAEEKSLAKKAKLQRQKERKRLQQTQMSAKLASAAVLEDCGQENESATKHKVDTSVEVEASKSADATQLQPALEQEKFTVPPEQAKKLRRREKMSSPPRKRENLKPSQGVRSGQRTVGPPIVKKHSTKDSAMEAACTSKQN